jgi:hypothetical protein
MNVPADLPKSVFSTAPRAYTPLFQSDTRIEQILNPISGGTNIQQVQRSISGFPQGIERYIAVDVNATMQFANGFPPPILATPYGYGTNYLITSMNLQFLRNGNPFFTIPIMVEGYSLEIEQADSQMQYFGYLSTLPTSVPSGFGAVNIAQAALCFRAQGLAIGTGFAGSPMPVESDYDVIFNYATAFDPGSPELLTGCPCPIVRQARKFGFDFDTVNLNATVAINDSNANAFAVGFGLVGIVP